MTCSTFQRSRDKNSLETNNIHAKKWTKRHSTFIRLKIFVACTNASLLHSCLTRQSDEVVLTKQDLIWRTAQTWQASRMQSGQNFRLKIRWKCRPSNLEDIVEAGSIWCLISCPATLPKQPCIRIRRTSATN